MTQLLQELNTLRTKPIQKMKMGQKVYYSFDTKKTTIHVHFSIRHTGLEAFVSFQRDDRETLDYDTYGNANSDSLEVFAMLPKVLKRFAEDYPNVRILEFYSFGKRLSIYKRMIEKFAKDMGWKIGREEYDGPDGRIELVRENKDVETREVGGTFTATGPFEDGTYKVEVKRGYTYPKMTRILRLAMTWLQDSHYKVFDENKNELRELTGRPDKVYFIKPGSFFDSLYDKDDEQLSTKSQRAKVPNAVFVLLDETLYDAGYQEHHGDDYSDIGP